MSSPEPTYCKAVVDSPGLSNQDCEEPLLSTFKCLPSDTLSAADSGQLSELCEYKDLFVSSGLDLGIHH